MQQNKQGQVLVRQPTRSEMRLVFELAAGAARTRGAQEIVTDVVLWHEVSWQQADEEAKQIRADEEAKQAREDAKGE